MKPAIRSRRDSFSFCPVAFFSLFFLVVLLPLLSGCSRDTPSGSSNTVALWSYSVDCTAMPADSLNIRITIDNCESDTLNLLAPPIYADNPPLIPAGRCFQLKSVTLDGIAVVPTYDSLQTGPQYTLMVKIPARQNSRVVIDYTVYFSYTANTVYTGMPRSYLSTHQGYLDGAYIFAVPAASSLLPFIWRAPINSTIEWKCATGMKPAGEPATGSSPKNIYEILFCRTAIIPENNSLFSRVSTSVAGQQMEIIDLDSTHSVNQSLHDHLADLMKSYLALTVPAYGILEEPITLLTGFTDNVALEGRFSFCITNLSLQDPDGGQAINPAHELMHFRIGVHCGETDMPWWKEGTTQYLGILLAARTGTVNDSLVAYYLKPGPLLKDNPFVGTMVLSDPSTRSLIYNSDTRYENIVYYKGGEIAMLIDDAITEKTDGRMDLFGTLGMLTQEYDGRGFDRQTYIRYIANKTGADISGILTEYEQKPGAIPDSIVNGAFERLKRRGWFSVR